MNLDNLGDDGEVAGQGDTLLSQPVIIDPAFTLIIDPAGEFIRAL